MCAPVGDVNQARLRVQRQTVRIGHLGLWPLQQPHRSVLVLRRFLERHYRMRVLDRHQQFLILFIRDDGARAVWSCKLPVRSCIAPGVAVKHGHPVQRVIVDAVDVARRRVNIHSASEFKKGTLSLNHALGLTQRRAGRRIRRSVIDENTEIILFRHYDFIADGVDDKAGKRIAGVLDAADRFSCRDRRPYGIARPARRSGGHW